MKAETDSRGAARRESIIAAAIILLHILILAYLAVFRYIDRDEGFYLSAATQVAGGRVPYIDFFFPQMPFLPFVLSLVTGHGFDTIRYARFLSIVPASLTPIAFWIVLKVVTRDRAVRLFSLYVYCMSGLILVWHSVAKSYAWTDLALILLFTCLVRIRSGGKIALWLVAGIAYGLAINFRSVLVVALIPAAVVWLSTRKQDGVRAGLLFLIGAVAVSLPTIWLFLQDPSRFYFDNLGFHFVRNPGVGLGSALLERVEAFGKFLLNPQFWIVGTGIVLAWRSRGSGSDSAGSGITNLSLWFAGAIAAVYVLPSPVHVQYFEQAWVFLLIAAIPGFGLWQNHNGGFFGLSKKGIILGIVVLYSAMLMPFAAIYLGAIRQDDRPYSIRNMKELTQFIRDYPVAGPVLSEWSGVPILAGRETTAGTEYIGFQYDLPLSPERQREYHFPVNEDLKKELKSQVPALYIVWNGPDTALVEAASQNYHLVREFDQFKVWARNEQPK